MRFSMPKLGMLFALVISAVLAFGDSKGQTFTGKVTDAMCGAHHMMADKSVGCLRACVKQGSKYALVVGDKVYTLDAKDKETLGKLDELADKNAKVTGTMKGSSIEVASVAAE